MAKLKPHTAGSTICFTAPAGPSQFDARFEQQLIPILARRTSSVAHVSCNTTRNLISIPHRKSTPLAAFVPLQHTQLARALLSAAACVSALAGCATGSNTDLFSQPPAYTLTSAEKNWHCEALQNAVQARITKIATLMQQAKAESDATAPTLSKLIARTFGAPGSDLSTLSQITPERAAADAYNETLKSKGCAPVDIDSKLPAVALPGILAASSR